MARKLALLLRRKFLLWSLAALLLAGGLGYGYLRVQAFKRLRVYGDFTNHDLDHRLGGIMTWLGCHRLDDGSDFTKELSPFFYAFFPWERYHSTRYWQHEVRPLTDNYLADLRWFPETQSIDLGVDFERFAATDLQQISRLSHLTELELTLPSTTTPEALAELRHLPRLKRLRLENLRFEMDEILQKYPWRSANTLEELVLIARKPEYRNGEYSEGMIWYPRPLGKETLTLRQFHALKKVTVNDEDDSDYTWQAIKAWPREIREMNDIPDDY